MNPPAALLYVVVYGILLGGWAYGFRHEDSAIDRWITMVFLILGFFAREFAEFAFPGHRRWAMLVTLVAMGCVLVNGLRRQRSTTGTTSDTTSNTTSMESAAG